MIVYRITKQEHATLDGAGGLFGPGRWHKKGNPVIYTSEVTGIRLLYKFFAG
jgi:RES domain-containing protein